MKPLSSLACLTRNSNLTSLVATFLTVPCKDNYVKTEAQNQYISGIVLYTADNVIFIITITTNG